MTKENPIQHSLSREDHGALNQGMLTAQERDNLISELRIKYSGNDLAQRKIDPYDPNSEYTKKWKEYRSALEAKNKATQTELENWFTENGYNL